MGKYKKLTGPAIFSSYATDPLSPYFEVFSAESLWARSTISSFYKGSALNLIEVSFKLLDRFLTERLFHPSDGMSES
jgi:hypothetical protein